MIFFGGFCFFVLIAQRLDGKMTYPYQFVWGFFGVCGFYVLRYYVWRYSVYEVFRRFLRFGFNLCFQVLGLVLRFWFMVCKVFEFEFSGLMTAFS